MSLGSTDLGDIAQACPLGGGRELRRLHVEFIVLHFTVIAAYANLLRLRNDGFVILRCLLVLLVPIFPLWLFVIPAIAMIAAAITTSFDKAAIRETFNVLYGRLPEHVAAKAPLDMPQTKVEARKVQSESGFFIIQLALIAQCGTSLFLFARRSAHSAAGPVDYRLMTLAIGGVCIGLLSLLHMFTDPNFPSIETESTDQNRHERIATLPGIRLFQWHQQAKDKGPTALQDLSGAFFVSFALAGILRVSLSETSRENTFMYIWPAGFVMLPLEFPIWVSLVVGVILALNAVPIVRQWRQTSERTTLGLLRDLILKVLPVPLIYAMILMISYTPICSAFELVTTIMSIGLIGTRPESIPCPPPWEDPIHDYVWWFV